MAAAPAMPIVEDTMNPADKMQVTPGHGYKDGLQAVLEDQQRIRDLHARYEGCPTPAKQEAGTGFDPKLFDPCLTQAKFIVEAASKHMDAMEKVLYPMIKYKVDPRKGAKMLHDRVMMDSTIGREMLDFLTTHIPESPEDFMIYDEHMKNYMRHLEQLFKSEEHQVVGQLRKLLSKEEKETLYERWQQALQEAPATPKPYGPVEERVKPPQAMEEPPTAMPVEQVQKLPGQ